MKKTTATLLLALLCFLPARAQGLALLFESEPGTRPAFVADDSPSSERFDANGDGTPDLILTREDNAGNLLGLLVLDVIAGLDTLVHVRDVPQALGLAERDGMKFVGFADPDADGTREALFTSDGDMFLMNPNDIIGSTAWSCSSALIQMGADPNCLLRAVTDLTGDGFEELILFLPETRQVQVWGKAN